MSFLFTQIVITVGVPLAALVLAGGSIIYTLLSLKQTAKFSYVQMLEGEVETLRDKLSDVEISEAECIKRCEKLESDNRKLLRRINKLEENSD